SPAVGPACGGIETRGDGRRNHDVALFQDRPVLPDPRRLVARLLPRRPEALRGPVLVRLRLPPGAHREPPPRGDGGARRRARRAVVQDLHVLRRLWAARPDRWRCPAPPPGAPAPRL